MTMPLTHITLTESARVAEVHLNRPEARNAMSQALMQELTTTAQALAQRSDINVVLLTGTGPCFTAGADLKEGRAWADGTQPLVAKRERAAIGYRMCRAWEDLPQISIVAIEGFAVGGGLALSLACDWRVLAEDAFVSLPEIALGIPLTWGAIPRLVALVGPARAKRLTILCERVAAVDALAMGLVDYTAPSGQALSRARQVAEQVLTMPAHAVRMSKETANAVATALHHLGGHMAHDQIMLAAASAEAQTARTHAFKPADKPAL